MVFNRFWRADPARARTSGGTGLGLSISLEDTHLHGGWLQAWGRPGEGAQFRLTLRAPPRHPAAPLARCRWCPTTPGRRREARRVRPSVGVAVAVVLALLAGCVQMPTSGPVDPGRGARRSTGDVPGISFDPRPPQAGAVGPRDRGRLPRGDEGDPDLH